MKEEERLYELYNKKITSTTQKEYLKKYFESGYQEEFLAKELINDRVELNEKILKFREIIIRFIIDFFLESYPDQELIKKINNHKNYTKIVTKLLQNPKIFEAMSKINFNFTSALLGLTGFQFTILLNLLELEDHNRADIKIAKKLLSEEELSETNISDKIENNMAVNIRHEIGNILKKFEIYQTGKQGKKLLKEMCQYHQDQLDSFTEKEWQQICDKYSGNDLKKRKIDDLLGIYKPSTMVDSKAYLSHEIERPSIVNNCIAQIKESASILRIKACHKMGKTWIINEIMHLLPRNYKKIYVDFAVYTIDQHSNNKKHFYKWLLTKVNSELGIENSGQKVDNFWEQEGGRDNYKFENYLVKHILNQIKDCQRLILAFDNVDNIFLSLEITKNFFPIIRSLINQPEGKELQKIAFIFSYSTDIYVDMDTNKSPFYNVGQTEKIPDFLDQEIQELGQTYFLSLDKEIIQKVIKPMIGGHPYLLKEFFSYYQKHYGKEISKEKVQDVFDKSYQDNGIYGPYLVELANKIVKISDLKAAIVKMINSEKPIYVEDRKVRFKLEGLGIVKSEKKCLEFRCQLYKKFFIEEFHNTVTQSSNIYSIDDNNK